MPKLALAIYVVYLAVAFGLRTWVQWRRTGSTGFKGLGGRPGSVEWLAGVGFAVAVVMGIAAPVLALLGVHEPIDALSSHPGHAIGAAIALAGIALTFWAQLTMGDSWRIGVDASERTELVTEGPFAHVRNPIFSAMIPTALGLVLIVPSVLAIAGLVALVIALEAQVRAVEEPYLLRTQGAAYAEWAARTGRFFPGVGLLGPADPAQLA